MSFLQIIGWTLLGLATAAIAISFLSYQNIINWFQQRSQLLEEDRERIGVSLVEYLQNGNYKVVQGVVNPHTEEIIEQRVIETQNIEEKLMQVHDDNGLAVWTV